MGRVNLIFLRNYVDPGSTKKDPGTCLTRQNHAQSFQSFESSESVSVKGFSVSKLLKYHRFAPPAGQNGAL